MEWRDEGIVLAARRYGESAAVAMLLTREHGRHAGLARGGAGRRGKALYQTGNRVQAVWRARLSDHLGSYACELIDGFGGRLFEDAMRLAALTAAAALIEAALPEREPHRPLYDRLLALIRVLEQDESGRIWSEEYVRFELALLAELGFGLDLSACAATGGSCDLAYVSPRSARAVSRAAGAPFRDKLLGLPAFLGGGGPPEPGDVVRGLALTGHFLEQHLFASPLALPPARGRLLDLLARPDRK